MSAILTTRSSPYPSSLRLAPLALVLAAAACDPAVDAADEQLAVADDAGALAAAPERGEGDDAAPARPLGGHHDEGECRGIQSAPRLSIEAPIVSERDLLLTGRDRALRVAVRNIHDGPLTVEPRLTWRFSGGVEREAMTRFEVAPGEVREVTIGLDRGFDTAAHPASLDVMMRTWHGRRRGNDESLPTTYFHADPAADRLHVYDHEGMVARHRAGDLQNRHRAVDARDDLDGVGVAHLARPDELFGDPTDVRSVEGESR